MKVAIFNANGLPGKADLIINFLCRHQVDLMFVSETWLAKERASAIQRTFLNMCKENRNIIVGGRRATGGILAFTNEKWQGMVRVVYEDPDGNFAITEAGETMYAFGYFPPSMIDRAVTDFFEKALELADGNRLIICGDLNARVGTVSGDHATNPRGNLVRRWVEENGLEIEKPVEGEFTSFNVHMGGFGMPDLVITANGASTRQLTAHENESLGGSDHRPLSWEIDGSPPARRFTRWNIRRLKEPEIRQCYYHTLQNTATLALSGINNTEACVENAWASFKSWVEDAAEISCGRLRYSAFSRRDFLTPQLRKLQQRHDGLLRELQTIARYSPSGPVRDAARRQVTEAAKEVREAVRERQNAVFQEMANELSEKQNAASLLRMLSGAKSRRNNKGCKLDPKRMDTHADHFQTTFGQNPEGNEAERLVDERYIPHFVDLIEMQTAFKHIPFGKAAGADGLMGELISYGKEIMIQVLTQLFNVFIREAKIPTEWRTAIIVPVYKHKGSDKQAENYRPIALTCITRRLFERILGNRLARAEEQLSDFQGGFRAKRSTMQQIFCLHESMLGRPHLRTVFLDLRAAYDSVDRRILWNRLRQRFGIDHTNIVILKALFDHNESYLVINGERSRNMQNKRGLLQGSSLSPMLFNFFINELLEELMQGPLLSVAGLKCNTFAFADDLVLLANSDVEMNQLLLICERWSIRVGMRFAPGKCISLDPGQETNYSLYNVPLTRALSAKYLGIPFTRAGIDLETNSVERAGKARAVAAMFASVGMNITGFAPKASVRIYKTFVRPMLEYGLALAPLAEISNALQPLQRTQNFALRAIVSAPRHTSINALHKLLQVASKESNVLLK